MNILAHLCAVCDQPMPCGCCRLYRGTLTKGGYGVMPGRWAKANGFAKTAYVHRWAYERAYGPIPDGMVVMHLCDRRACFRVEHLRVGTHADNHADAVAKGRKRDRLPRTGPCQYGHEDGWKLNNKGVRICRTCSREADERANLRRRNPIVDSMAERPALLRRIHEGDVTYRMASRGPAYHLWVDEFDYVVVTVHARGLVDGGLAERRPSIRPSYGDVVLTAAGAALIGVPLRIVGVAS